VREKGCAKDLIKIVLLDRIVIYLRLMR
jgi:hypothetical protein